MAVNEVIKVTVLMNRHANRALKTLIQRTFQALIEATPVRTGFAQSNWLIGVGRSIRRTPVGSRSSVNYGPQQEGHRTIRQYTMDKGSLVMYNNAPHIGLLNRGHSPQASKGFVETTIKRMVKEVERTKFR